MYKDNNRVRNVTSLLDDQDQNIAGKIGDKLSGATYYFDINSYKASDLPYFVIYAVNCEGRVGVSDLNRIKEDFTKIKEIVVDFDLIDNSFKKMISTYYFLVEKNNSSYESPKVKDKKPRSLNIMYGVNDNDKNLKYLKELVDKFDRRSIDREANSNVSYKINYGDANYGQRYVIDIEKIHGSVNLLKVFKEVKAHIRGSCTSLESLITEITFDCNSRNIRIELKSEEVGKKHGRSDDDDNNKSSKKLKGEHVRVSIPAKIM